MLYAYSKIDRVGLGCPEGVRDARCHNLMMRTQRKMEIGMFHIASLESITMQVWYGEVLIPFQETQFAKAGRAPAGKI